MRGNAGKRTMSEEEKERKGENGQNKGKRRKGEKEKERKRERGKGKNQG